MPGVLCYSDAMNLDDRALTPKTITRTVTSSENGTTHELTLRRLRIEQLQDWQDEEKIKARKLDVLSVPAEDEIVPDARERMLVSAANRLFSLDDLRFAILEGQGAYRVLRIAMQHVKGPDGKPDPVTGDDADDFLESADYRQNIRDAAILSGLFTPTEVAYRWPDLSPGPLEAFIGALFAGDVAAIDAAATAAKAFVTKPPVEPKPTTPLTEVQQAADSVTSPNAVTPAS